MVKADDFIVVENDKKEKITTKVTEFDQVRAELTEARNTIREILDILKDNGLYKKVSVELQREDLILTTLYEEEEEKAKAVNRV